MKLMKRVAAYLLVILCLSAGGVHFMAEVNDLGPSSLSADMVSGWEQHMKLIRELIPPDVYVAGYVEKANLPGPRTRYDDAEFFMTQYGVAPIALVKGIRQEWIIGNFGSTVSLESIKPWLDQNLGRYEVQELGFGIYLIHDLEN